MTQIQKFLQLSVADLKRSDSYDLVLSCQLRSVRLYDNSNSQIVIFETQTETNSLCDGGDSCAVQLASCFLEQTACVKHLRGICKARSLFCSHFPTFLPVASHIQHQWLLFVLYAWQKQHLCQCTNLLPSVWCSATSLQKKKRNVPLFLWLWLAGLESSTGLIVLQLLDVAFCLQKAVSSKILQLTGSVFLFSIKITRFKRGGKVCFWSAAVSLFS